MTAKRSPYEAWNEVRNLSIAAGLCKRVRFRKSECRQCVEICPEDAITLSPGPSLNSRCSGCGLCVATCPTEVFNATQNSDQALLKKAVSLAEEHPANQLHIHCERVTDCDRHSCRVNCLGSISEYSFLGAIWLGFEEFILVKADCSLCRLKHGEKLVTQTIRISKVLLAGIGLSEINFSLLSKEPVKAPTWSRRAIFSGFYNRLEAATESRPPAESMMSKALPKRDRGETRHSIRSKMLRRLLEKRRSTSAGGKNSLDCGPDFPWGQLRISGSGCTACEICSKMCPTGAISVKSRDSCKHLYFDASACTNCALCAESCPEEVIVFEGNLSPEALARAEPRLVAKVKLDPCIACGETITARESGLCPTCRKRHVQPHVWLLRSSQEHRPGRPDEGFSGDHGRTVEISTETS